MMAVNFAGMSQADIEALIRQQYGNIGLPTANSDSRYGANGQGNGYYSGGGLDFLSPTGSGYTGPIGAPYDQPGQGGMYGQQFGTWGADGSLTGSNWQQTERPTFLDQNGWIFPAAVAGFGLVDGGTLGSFNGSPSTAVPNPTGAATAGGNAASAGIADAVNPGWVSGADLPAGPMVGTDAAGFTGATSVPQVRLPAGGIDSVGSDWAAGTPTGPTGGLIPPATPNILGVDPSIIKAGASVIGAVAGASDAGSGTATSSTSVPEWAQPYGQDIVKRGQNIANTPFQPYTGTRYAEPNDAMRTSWEMVNQFANGGPSAAQQVSMGTFNRLQGAEVPDFGKAQQISNQYIGQTTPGASNQYIGQNANSNVSALVSGQTNPFLGQTTGSIGPLGQMKLDQTTTAVGKNALLGQNNPYLNDAIGYATGDITRNFQNTINPQLDRMARASGSFGNSGVEQARQEAERTMAQQIGRTTGDMRMADYNLQAQLGEGDLGRRLQAGLTDASRNLGASQAMQQFNIGNDFARQQANLGYRAGDLSRNMTGYDAQQNRTLDAGKFDATNAQQNWQTNLGATSDLSKFNAGLAQADLGRNATLSQDLSKFNATQGNFDITNAMANWNTAENRAMQSMDAYKGYDDATLRRAGVLGATGAAMQTEAQKPLTAAYDEFLRQQQDPYTRQTAYQQAYNTGVNGQSVQSTPTGGNAAAQTIGGAITGLSLYDMLTRPTASTQPAGGARWLFDPITGQRY